MALVPCPECGKNISDEATACPACGKSLSEEERKPRLKRVTWGLQDHVKMVEEETKDTGVQRWGCRYPLLALILIPILVIIYLLLR